MQCFPYLGHIYISLNFLKSMLQIYPVQKEYLPRAQALADLLSCPLTDAETGKAAEIALRVDEQGLALTGDGQEFRGDFRRLLPRLRHNNLSHELLVKAARIKKADHPLTAVDATAGMGEDALLLAAAGFSVELCESNPVIAVLLQDTLDRASADPDLAPIVSRMQVHACDSRSFLMQLLSAPDVVLLDPMFPAKQKNSLMKKKFQLIHKLEQPCREEASLLEAALTAHPHKIIIKRPHKGPFLAGRKPDYSLDGKAIRYDCILL